MNKNRRKPGLFTCYLQWYNSNPQPRIRAARLRGILAYLG